MYGLVSIAPQNKHFPYCIRITPSLGREATTFTSLYMEKGYHSQTKYPKFCFMGILRNISYLWKFTVHLSKKDEPNKRKEKDTNNLRAVKRLNPSVLVVVL